MKHVFIIGSKGIPAKYGGFETFVHELTFRKKNKNIFYHVSCIADNNNEFFYNNARCFNIKVPNIGSARAVIYDLISLNRTLKYIEENKLNNSIVYILACRIGPFLFYFQKKMKKLGVEIFVNPDGHEWKRSKWNTLIKMYWKFSERLMIKCADLIICDSRGIEDYINNEYFKYNPNTTFLTYGADIESSQISNENGELLNWYNKYQIKPNNYYLIVGRFVPENNYDFIIKEFMKSKTEKDLVIVTNVENNKFFKKLQTETNFSEDSRIKFVGTIYNQELLKKVRENAYGYIHGHEVGGTNPSLLEGLASTNLNILLDVVFNKEVGGDCALYFDKVSGRLTEVINSCDNLPIEVIENFGMKAKGRITEKYHWDNIVNEYEKLFIK